MQQRFMEFAASAAGGQVLLLRFFKPILTFDKSQERRSKNVFVRRA
jgi:hypothetical protein